MASSEAVPPPLPLERLREAALARLPPEDAAHLLNAVKLGRRGWGSVHPNPMVGCVLARGGEEMGRGWHRIFGGPHAEVGALRTAVQEDLREVTAYVSLEPCAHHGKTPPCTVALREAGISRVVYGAADPTGEAGGGGEWLRDQGVEVVGPVFAPELARKLDPAFFHRAGGSERPYVALKLALSADGMIASGEGERTEITGPEAGRYTHRLRAGFDGILVGAGTAAADDPLLTVRGEVEPRRPPFRLVLDSQARVVTPGAAFFRDAGQAPVHVFTGPEAPEIRIRALESAGATVHRVPPAPEGVELSAVLRVCWQEGITSILCEGGAGVARSLLDEDLAERAYVYRAPDALGEAGVRGFPDDSGPESRPGWRAWGRVETLGRDALTLFDRER